MDFRKLSKSNRQYNFADCIYSFQKENNLFNSLKHSLPKDLHNSDIIKSSKYNTPQKINNLLNPKSSKIFESDLTVSNKIIQPILKKLQSIKFRLQNDTNNIFLKKFKQLEQQWISIINQLMIQNIYLRKQLKVVMNELVNQKDKLKNMQYQIVSTKLHKITSQYEVQKLKNLGNFHNQKNFSKQQIKQLNFNDKIACLRVSYQNSPSPFDISPKKKSRIFYSQSKSQLQSYNSLYHSQQYKILSDDLPIPPQLLKFLGSKLVCKKIYCDNNSNIRAFYYCLIKDIFIHKKQEKIDYLKKLIQDNTNNIAICTLSTIPSQYRSYYNNNILKKTLSALLIQIQNTNIQRQIQSLITKHHIFDFVSLLFCKSIIYKKSKFQGLRDFKSPILTQLALKTLGQFFNYFVQIKQTNNNLLYFFKQNNQNIFTIYDNKQYIYIFEQNIQKKSKHHYITQQAQQEYSDQQFM